VLTRPRSRMVVTVAAAIALVVPVSDACASVGPLGGQGAARTKAYLAAPAVRAPHAAGQLTTRKPSKARLVLSGTDHKTGWVEVRASGASVLPSPQPPAPDGHGYLWSAADLGGSTVAAGSWTTTITLAAKGSMTATPRVRIYRHNSSGYSLIVATTGVPTRLTSRQVRITLTSKKIAAVSLATGDHLYLDVLAKVSTAGDGIEHLDNAGSASALSFPHHRRTPAPVAQPRPKPTAGPTTGPVATPTPKPSTKPTGSPTPKPTGKPKPTPTPKPKPKPKPTPTPTPKPKPAPTTTAPPTTTPPTTAPVVTGSWWKPKPGTTWQWQITGTVDPTLNVDMYDIDLFDAQSSSSYTVPGFGTVNVPTGDNPGIIANLHSRGRIVICYMDSGAYESYRPDASLFPSSVIGNNTGWDGENWLDIRPASWSKFEPIIEARLDLAKRSGCDGVEPDENNPLGNNPGFSISQADQQAWYLEVARLAHARGLSVGMKNGIETTDAATIAAFDWNLNEECNKYSECSVLDGFISAGKAVFQVEYQDEGMTTSFCASDNAQHFDGLLKQLELGTWREACE
jgi:hypothetical protein